MLVYIANKPNMPEYRHCNSVQAMTSGEITAIGLACGNGWRKVFNVYSKLLYALDANDFSFKTLAPTWQTYRDDFLLQQGSATALLFSAPLLLKELSKELSKESQANSHCIHIISGKTYAKTLIDSGLLNVSLIWIDEYFAIDVQKRLIVCPYFDYRQLSNQKIEQLAKLMSGLVNQKTH
ncbi:hypothetical protein CXF74_06585 [Psychromonas sp. Urea-02u-13]|nr:hypothetical protein [Psychromonas sp. Urea-02u-13]PKG39828.1 hypothetical protein CXF74_06585 [Psychromonas sp. Urea-02u-13]